MTPEEKFIQDYADNFGGVPPHTALILKDLVSKAIAAAHQEVLAHVREQLESVKRSSVATTSLNSVVDLINEKISSIK